MPKKRLDILLTERGLARSRNRAQALILAGAVLVDNEKIVKSGALTPEECEITIKKKQADYVSRGGIKLAYALDRFGIDPSEKICADVGSSTGGFTDCLLQRGAAKVWALDSGVNQLDYRLRIDNRVIVLEKTNVRKIDPAIITDSLDIIVADVSFISLRLVIPPLLGRLSSKTDLALLVKPQFEAGRDKVGKGGIVKDARIHQEVIENLKEYFVKEERLAYISVCESPIQGAKGNREYFLHFKKV
ncbi:MAG TPA: TlyA family RNA methyltransferase [Nitrospirae bacterium]|nr:TlyA family RNA methyltransferase [Nitrospirota bacterium]